MLVCAGCDGVFGINPVPLPTDAAAAGDGTSGDGAPGDDAPAGELTIVLPATPAVWVDDTEMLTATIHGPIHAPVMTTASATVGIASTPGSLLLDGNGLGDFPVTYKAPSNPGPAEVTFMAQTGSLSAGKALAFTIAPLTSLGIDAMQGVHQPINANDAIGERLTISTNVTVRKLGLWAASAGTHVRLGIYGVNNTATPGQLQVQAAPIALVAGRNEVDITPTPLTPGDYWIVADFDGSTELQYVNSTTGLYGTSNYAYASTFPLVWSATWVDVSGTTFALFMRVEQ